MKQNKKTREETDKKQEVPNSRRQAETPKEKDSKGKKKGIIMTTKNRR